MSQNNRAIPKAQQIQRPQPPQFKIDSKSQQPHVNRIAPSSTGKNEIQQRNNIPLQSAPKPADINLFKASMVQNTPSVVTKSLLETKTVNNVLIETYQFKYSDNTYLNKTYLDGFLVSSVDPVGGTRVTYQTNIQAANEFINRDRGSGIRYQPGSGFINNLNYDPSGEQNLNLNQQPNFESINNNLYNEQNLNPNYQNRFLTNLIV
jgi:hypothetical protein